MKNALALMCLFAFTFAAVHADCDVSDIDNRLDAVQATLDAFNDNINNQVDQLIDDVNVCTKKSIFKIVSCVMNDLKTQLNQMLADTMVFTETMDMDVADIIADVKACAVYADCDVSDIDNRLDAVQSTFDTFNDHLNDLVGQILLDVNVCSKKSMFKIISCIMNSIKSQLAQMQAETKAFTETMDTEVADIVADVKVCVSGM